MLERSEAGPTDNSLSLLKLTFTDAAVLAGCSMSFLQNHGIFVPSTRQVCLGQRFFLLLRAGPESEPAGGLARVCWITPEGASEDRAAGFGLHFDASAVDLKRWLVNALAAHVDPAEARKHTL